MKALGDAVNRLAVLIEAVIPDHRETVDDATQARHRQTPFPPLFHILRNRRDGRIDKDRFGHRRRIRVALVVPEAENHDLQIDADLRGGKPCAVCVVHRLEHVLDERMQLGGIEMIDRFGYAQKARIAHLQNFANHWVWPSKSLRIPSSSSTGMPSSSAFASLLPASVPATT